MCVCSTRPYKPKGPHIEHMRALEQFIASLDETVPLFSSFAYNCCLSHRRSTAATAITHHVHAAATRRHTIDTDRHVSDTALLVCVAYDVLFASVAELRALARRLDNEPRFAIDVEHHSHRSFLGITCLIQVNRAYHVCCVSCSLIRRYRYRRTTISSTRWQCAATCPC